MDNQPWLAAYSTFEKAFPEIKSICVLYTQIGDGTDNRRFPIQHKKNLPTKLKCLNPFCKRGGVQLQDHIEYMSFSKIKSKTFNVHCQGDEGSLKGRRKGNPCENKFEISIEIEYHISRTEPSS